MRVVLCTLLLCLPIVAAEPYLAGEDPAGDSSNQIAPGVDVGDVISNDRTDIRAVSFDEDDGTLFVKLSLTAPPSGTSGYMYRVVFDVGATRYYTCWAVQFTANEGQATQENTLGCSRFTSNTAVGPSTRAAGIVLEESTITWPVAKSSIGGAGLSDLTATFADTWFRGVSNCCAGSTTQTQYMWNRADRAPDEGTYAIELAVAAPAVPGIVVNMTSPAAMASAPPGGFALYNVSLHSSAPANITFIVDGLDWNVTGLEPWNGTGNATRDFWLQVPDTEPNGTFIFEVQALVDGNVTGRLELQLQVDASATGSPPPGTTGDETTPDDEPGSDHEDADEAPAEDTPLPLWVVLTALVLARRRR